MKSVVDACFIVGSDADDCDGDDEILEDDARLPENCTSRHPWQAGRVRNIILEPEPAGHTGPRV